MGSILPETMQDNPRWRIAIPEVLWTDTPRSKRYVRKDDGNLVAPWSALGSAIGSIDNEKSEIGSRKNLCSGCGTIIQRDSVAVFLKSPEDLERIIRTHEEGSDMHDTEMPLHLACAGYAIRACPHMRFEKWSAIIASSWHSITKCEDCGRPEFWPDLDAPHEILGHEEFIEMTRPKSPK